MPTREKLYMQVYDYYKGLIENGRLTEGERLPSIRRCSEERGVSKTTIEQAYMCLCDDGYILPKSQSGYYVAKRAKTVKTRDKTSSIRDERSTLLYNFASSGADSESFDMRLWQRYIKSALRQTERLLFYGEPQGEEDLRREIAGYARETRNCVCDESNIVVGAGVQTLLAILCPLLGKRRTVFFDDLLYKQGTAVFRDHGFSVTDSKNKSEILYVSPSYAGRWGDAMSAGERFSLTEYARETGKLIIEDDYGSEFRYINRPTPSLQSLDGGENTVYLGTFSKLLLPSIRISFMILPPSLMPVYTERGTVYNQTVSKSEQIALCSYIRDGHLSSQIRKSRNLYSQKAKLLSDALSERFGASAEIIRSHSPLYVRCRIKCPLSPEEVEQAAKRERIAVIPAGKASDGAEIALCVSSVGAESFSDAADLLYRAVFTCE